MGTVRESPSGPRVNASGIQIYRLPLVSALGPIPADGLRWDGDFKQDYTYQCSVCVTVVSTGVPSLGTTDSLFMAIADNLIQPPCANGYATKSAVSETVTLIGSFVAAADFDYMTVRETTPGAFTMIQGAPYFNVMTVIEYAP